MKRYRLKKDLPTIKAGATFKLDDKRGLVLLGGGKDTYGSFIPNVFVLYDKAVLDIFPNILTDWFEEIPEEAKTVWNLKEDEWCCYMDASGEICPMNWSFENEPLREVGNIFRTTTDAEKELARRRAKQILLRDTKGFKPDWRNSNQEKYIVYFDHGIDLLNVDYWCAYHTSAIHFANEADARASIKAHPEEWKTYLGVEE